MTEAAKYVGTAFVFFIFGLISGGNAIEKRCDDKLAFAVGECTSTVMTAMEKRCDNRVERVYYRMCEEQDMPVGGGGYYEFGHVEELPPEWCIGNVEVK